MYRFKTFGISTMLIAACALLVGLTAGCAHVADQKVAKKETTAGKLVVVKAVYGDLPAGDKTDVTGKVAAMVKDNALSVEASNDNFGDPVEGTVKKLEVAYTFGGVAKTKTVDENETLTISNTGE